jgi:hypothetical protein
LAQKRGASGSVFKLQAPLKVDTPEREKHDYCISIWDSQDNPNGDIPSPEHPVQRQLRARGTRARGPLKETQDPGPRQSSTLHQESTLLVSSDYEAPHYESVLLSSIRITKFTGCACLPDPKSRPL